MPDLGAPFFSSALDDSSWDEGEAVWLARNISLFCASLISAWSRDIVHPAKTGRRRKRREAGEQVTLSGYQQQYGDQDDADMLITSF